MALHTRTAADAIKSACDKGHNWITNRANKLNKVKALKVGYNQIRPKILPKGLSTFKKEHCERFDDNEDHDHFLKYRSRIHSVDIIDNQLREKFIERHNASNDEFIYDFRAMNINGLSSITAFELSFDRSF